MSKRNPKTCMEASDPKEPGESAPVRDKSEIVDGMSGGQHRLRNLISASEDPPLQSIKECYWRQAIKRAEAVRLVLHSPATLSEVEQIAGLYGIDASTLYRWVNRFLKGGGRISSLVRIRRSDVGSTRLDSRAEAILQKAVDDYQTNQQKSVTSVWADADDACEDEGIDTPHINTLRNRIKQISKQELTAKRFGVKTARDKFGLLPSSFQGATAPHSLVEIDHTLTDLILLEEETRLTIGRAYITIVLDVYSRVVLGFYISLDPPSSLSVGLAISHAVLPKGPWLDRLGLSISWPCQGLIGCIYSDNAKEFHSEMLARACLEYGIDLQFRPLTRPEFGGHVERFIKTLMSEMHTIPGTTFSSVAEKGDYDSEGKACMTLRELERWIAHFIAGVYHNRPHRGIGGETPLHRYQGWYTEHGGALGISGAPLPDDERRFQLDFLPFEKRTIQRGCVSMFVGKLYSDDQLRPFSGEKDPLDPKSGRKFHFAYDPRDISTIYFWHPIKSEFVPIPQKDSSQPPMSLWELRERSRQKVAPNPEAKPKARRSRKAMKQIETTAKERTQGARRKSTKRELHKSDNIHITLAEVDSVTEASMPDAEKSVMKSTRKAETWLPQVPFGDVE